MAITPFKTFSAEELTFTDLNSSFTQITDNGEDLGWPATKAKDLNAQELTLDADGDSSLTSDTDDRLDIKLQGVDQFRFNGTVTSPVNGFDFIGSATGNAPSITAQGSDTDISIDLISKGTGTVLINGAALGIWELIGTATASTSATIDFNWGSTVFKKVVLLVNKALPTADDNGAYFRTSTDDGSTFDTTNAYAWFVETNPMHGTNTDAQTGDDADDQIVMANATATIGFATNEGWSGIVEVIMPTETEHTSVVFSGHYASTDSSNHSFRGSGVRLSAADVNAIRFIFATDTIASGEFACYGLR